MVFVVGVAAAALLGFGWVLQQRVAVHSSSSGLMSWSLLRDLIGTWMWWGGIAAMTAGQSLSAWALQLGPVTLVEPLLVTGLLFAFIVSAIASHERVRWQEIVGTVVLCCALGAFLAVADPRADKHLAPTRPAIIVGAVVIALVAAGLVALGKTVGSLAIECVLIGLAAGAMYGLQDAATRGAIVAVQHRAVLDLVRTPWPYVVLAAATAGVLLSQSAFRAGRLDYALPPTTTAQAIAGVLLGIGVLEDQLSVSGAGIAAEIFSLVALIVGVVLIARSPAFG